MRGKFYIGTKKLCCTAMLMVLLFTCKAQQASMYNHGVEIDNYHEALYINGSFVQDSGDLFFPHEAGFGLGTIHITDSLLNNSAANLSTPYAEGAVLFIGDSNSLIGGVGGSIVFDEFYLQKSQPTASVQLQQNISVADSVVFNSGNILLNGDTLLLIENNAYQTNGNLYNENETNRIWGLGEIRKAQFVNTGAFAAMVNYGGMGGSINSAEINGDFTARRGHNALVTNAGPGIQRYYNFDNVTTTNPASLQFGYFDGDLNGSAENSMVFFRSDDNVASWIDFDADSSSAIANFAQTDTLHTLSLFTIRNCDAAPVIPQAQGGVYCGAATVTLNGGNNKSRYLWSTGETTQTISLPLSGPVSFNDTIFIRVDSAGCHTTDTIYLAYHPAIVLNLPDSAKLCFGNSLLLDATQPDSTATYSWWVNDTTNLFSNNAQIMVDSTGNYIVAVDYAGQCRVTDVVVVSGNVDSLLGPVAVLPTLQNLKCYADNSGGIELEITGGTGVYNIAWNTGDSIQNLAGLSQGTYTVTITDQNLCGVSDTFSLAQPDSLYAVITKTDEGCPVNDGGSITVTVAGGITPYHALWSNGDSTLNLANLNHGTYNLTVTDANGCNISASVVIDTLPPVEATFLVASVVDAEDTIRFIDVSYPKPDSYSWQFGDAMQTTSTDTNPVFSYPKDFTEDTSEYLVTLIVTQAGCSDTLTKIVKVSNVTGKTGPPPPDPVAALPLQFITIKAYPNPTAGDLKVAIELNKEGPVEIKLFNLAGQSLFVDKLSGSKQYNYSLNLNDFSAGIYMVRVQLGVEVRSLRIALLK